MLCGPADQIVITTYQTVATDRTGSVSRADAYSDDEFEPATQKGKKKQKTASRTLAGVNWKRILADEGHQLKNPKSQMAQAFAALPAARRWICTGELGVDFAHQAHPLSTLPPTLALSSPVYGSADLWMT